MPLVCARARLARAAVGVVTIELVIAIPLLLDSSFAPVQECYLPSCCCHGVASRLSRSEASHAAPQRAAVTRRGDPRSWCACRRHLLGCPAPLLPAKPAARMRFKRQPRCTAECLRKEGMLVSWPTTLTNPPPPRQVTLRRRPLRAKLALASIVKAAFRALGMAALLFQVSTSQPPSTTHERDGVIQQLLLLLLLTTAAATTTNNCCCYYYQQLLLLLLPTTAAAT